MAHTNNIPTLANLALQYGTIDQGQYRHLSALHALEESDKNPLDYDQLLLNQKFATRYQIELLKLIQEYYIIKKRGEEFGEIAIDKGFATPLDVQKALEFQKKEFKRARVKKLIGDILVASRVITTKQKNNILKEQLLLEQRADNIFSSKAEKKPVNGSAPQGRKITELAEPDLSDYEKNFLRIKVLDREFAARVTEKGLASDRQVIIAQKVQEEEFEKQNNLKILADVMVSMAFISEQQKDIILNEQNRSRNTQNLEKDESGIEVIVSPDKMVARVKINKSVLPKTTVPQIKAILNSHGITSGIYPDPLLQGHLAMEILEFPAARSDISSKIKKAKKIVLCMETNLSERGEKRKGDPLAQQNNSQNTLLLSDVFGKELKFDCSKTAPVRCGSGTRLARDGSIVAAKTGIPAVSVEGKLFVHPVIHVLEDADLRYGPLEAFANLSISGVLTGAYPVTAGNIKAREIRGAKINAIGNIQTDVGITDAVIRTQGDIHARYLHNCQIETFGNIYIENEIFDSKLICSGKIDSPGCRIISSDLFAKKGVTLAGAGSEKTASCTITSGGEHHILELEKSIGQEIHLICAELEAIKEKKDEQKQLSQKAFQKMIELKIFHDRAKNRKRLLAMEFKKNRDQLSKTKLKNIAKLISNFETRIEKSIASLKELNKIKKLHDQKKVEFEKEINVLAPSANAAIGSLEENLFSFFEWTRYQENISRIEIKGRAFPGTHFSGIYSTLKIDSSLENFSVVEVINSPMNYKMEILETPE